MKEYTDILKAPILTEKTSGLKEQKKYVFEVAIDANKIEIKKAIEELYKVKVSKVNTHIRPGKEKRVRFKTGFTKKRKIAIVTLASGEIDLFKAQ